MLARARRTLAQAEPALANVCRSRSSGRGRSDVLLLPEMKCELGRAFYGGGRRRFSFTIHCVVMAAPAAGEVGCCIVACNGGADDGNGYLRTSS